MYTRWGQEQDNFEEEQRKGEETETDRNQIGRSANDILPISVLTEVGVVAALDL